MSDDFDAYTTHKHPGNPVPFDYEKRDLYLRIADLEAQLATVKADRLLQIELKATFMRELNEVELKLAEAHKDEERLDWIDTLSSSGLNSVGNGDYSYYVHGEGYPKVREVIDKARAEGK